MNINQQKYILLLETQFSDFTKKSENLYNFRCPYCNDSSKNKKKKRGFLYEKRGNFYYFCHNCTISKNFSNFLKENNSLLYRSYLMDNIKEYKEIQSIKAKKTIIEYKDINLPCLNILGKNHSARKYIEKRNIPMEYLKNLYYAENFKQWINENYINGKFKTDEYDEPRIIIPLYSRTNTLIGFISRSILENTKLRYININLRDDFPRFYGLNKVNLNETFYVLEGIFDSFFIKNSIAALGSNILSELNSFKFEKSNCVIIYDNQPRNLEIVSLLNKVIDLGYKSFIWPSNIEEKDINEYIIKNNKEDILNIIRSHTYKGLEAKIKFTAWRKV